MNATSLGGVTSVMESRYRWEGDRVPEGLLRLSAGLEDADALWADLAQALDAPDLISRLGPGPCHSRPLGLSFDGYLRLSKRNYRLKLRCSFSRKSRAE